MSRNTELEKKYAKQLEELAYEFGIKKIVPFIDHDGNKTVHLYYYDNTSKEEVEAIKQKLINYLKKRGIEFKSVEVKKNV